MPSVGEASSEPPVTGNHATFQNLPQPAEKSLCARSQPPRRVVVNCGVGGSDPSSSPYQCRCKSCRPTTTPDQKVIIVGKNEIYNRENVGVPFLAHKRLGPFPPPLPPSWGSGRAILTVTALHITQNQTLSLVVRMSAVLTPVAQTLL